MLKKIVTLSIFLLIYILSSNLKPAHAQGACFGNISLRHGYCSEHYSCLQNNSDQDEGPDYECPYNQLNEDRCCVPPPQNETECVGSLTSRYGYCMTAWGRPCPPPYEIEPSDAYCSGPLGSRYCCITSHIPTPTAFPLITPTNTPPANTPTPDPGTCGCGYDPSGDCSIPTPGGCNYGFVQFCRAQGPPPVCRCICITPTPGPTTPPTFYCGYSGGSSACFLTADTCSPLGCQVPTPACPGNPPACAGQRFCVCPIPNPMPTEPSCSPQCQSTHPDHPFGYCLIGQNPPNPDPGNCENYFFNCAGGDCYCCMYPISTSNAQITQRPELALYCDSSGNATTATPANNQTAKLYTAIGCIPLGSQNDFLIFILRWALGIAGGIAFLLIIYAGFLIMTSGGDKQKLQAGKELLTAAVSGLLLLIFSVFILDLVGLRILQIPGL